MSVSELRLKGPSRVILETTMESPPDCRRSNHHCRQWFAAILVYSLVLPRCDTISVSTSCTTSSAVEGQLASVTCQFPEDLSVHKHDIRITRYDFDGLWSLPEIVFECYWYLADAFRECAAAAGFDWERHIRDTVTLKIRNATQRHAGVYKCDYINADYSHENGCSLYVRRREISCTGMTAYQGEPAIVTCHFNSDLSMTYDSFYVARLSPGDNYYYDVLTCIWTESEPSRTLCYERPGYSLDDKVTNIVTVHIPATDQSHVGHYFCDTSPTRRGVARPVCNVAMIERTTVSPSPTISDSTTTQSRTSIKQSGFPSIYNLSDSSGERTTVSPSPTISDSTTTTSTTSTKQSGFLSVSYQPESSRGNSSTPTPHVAVLMQVLMVIFIQHLAPFGENL